MSLDERRSVLDRACPCCTQDPQAPLFSLCSDLVSLSKYGVGYVLYFQLIKFAIFLCFIMSLFQIYKLRENIGSEVCSSISPRETPGEQNQSRPSSCQRSWVITHSIANYGLEKEDLTDKWLMIGFLCLAYLCIAGHKQILGNMDG